MSQQASHLFDQAVLKHATRARFQTLLKRCAVRIESQLDRRIAFERAGRGRRRHRPSGEQADLEGAHGLLHITRMNARGGGGFQSPENAVQAARPGLFPREQARADTLMASGQGWQAFEQRAEVEPSASHHHRQAAAA